MDASHDDDALLIPALTEEVRTLGQALIDRDLLEARFRSALLVSWAQTLGLAPMELAARRLSERLHPPAGPPGPGVGEAYEALFASVEALGLSEPPPN